MKRLALLACACALALPAAAEARDPIMPLAQVRAGMHCTGLTVVQGTTIASFDADVVDVVDDIGDGQGPEVLIRVSGPAVDVSGVAEGFSGSPILCKDSNGVDRNIGGIGYGLGDFGNKLALVTPIQAMLGQPVTPPARRRRLSRRERASVRSLTGPVTVSGLTPSLARRLNAVARAHGRSVFAAPSLSRAFPVQQLRPGASASASYSSGAIDVNAIGTVTYTDGNSVWAFGHPLDDAGRRNLLLQDAYVFTVVPNPNGDIGTSYKLAAAGHTVGTLTGDMSKGVTGLVGLAPKTTRLTVNAHDPETRRHVRTRTTVADELDLDSTGGISPLGLTGALAVLDAAERVLQSEPGRTTARMCVTAVVAFRADPPRFCNRYVGDVSVGGSGEAFAADDVDAATALLESVEFGGLRLKAFVVDLDVRRGLDQAFLDGVSAKRTVKAGHALGVTAHTSVFRGPRRAFHFDVHVPKGLRTGSYKLVVSGPGPDGTDGDELSQLLADLLGGGGGGGSDIGPRTYDDLWFGFADMHRYDGLRARFVPVGGGRGKRSHPKPFRAYRSRAYRIGGSASTRVEVTRP